MKSEDKVKADLAAIILRIKKKRGLTQKKTEKLSGAAQSVLCRIEKKQFKHVSIYTLLSMLCKLGYDVNVFVLPVINWKHGKMTMEYMI